MQRFETIMVPLSATAADAHLLSYVRLLAELGLGKHYHFVHVRTEARRAADQQTDAEILQECENRVREIFDSSDVTAAHSCHLLEGVRVDRLLEFIAANKCDLAFVGHRKSRSGHRSLAQRLAMIASCSVWLVPEDAPLTLSNVLVPVDFSDHAADSVEVAASIARAAGLNSCLLTHVYSDPSMIRYDEHIENIRNREQEAFEKFVAPLNVNGVEIENVAIEGNNVGATLLYTAKRYDADLIVMNTRGRSRAASILLGSVTKQVMVETPVALLAVKHAGAMMTLFEVLKSDRSWIQPSPKTN